jgi:hypothetical protein
MLCEVADLSEWVVFSVDYRLESAVFFLCRWRIVRRASKRCGWRVARREVIRRLLPGSACGNPIPRPQPHLGHPPLQIRSGYHLEEILDLPCIRPEARQALFA